MEYMHREISAKYELAFFTQDESRHLQNFILSDLLEIDIGYGGYEHAAAWKPAFKVLFDHSGTVEEKMIRSREWMDDSIGEGNGNPLQCSCLENPRDRGAWRAAVYGVAQSWTRLKRLSSSRKD